MGLFDFFLSEEKKIAKHVRRLTNRDSQPEDREGSAIWLAESGNPQALMGLLSRFDMSLDHQLKDSGEKDFTYEVAMSVGTDLIEPLKAWLRKCKQAPVPLRLLEELAGEEAAIQMVYELLQRELDRDDFKAAKKKSLLIWLAERRHGSCIDTATPFLKDFDEGVRYAAVEVVIAQKDAAGGIPLGQALLNPEEESNRLKVRIAEVLAQRGWPIEVEDEDAAERMPDGFALRDNRVVRT